MKGAPASSRPTSPATAGSGGHEPGTGDPASRSRSFTRYTGRSAYQSPSAGAAHPPLRAPHRVALVTRPRRGALRVHAGLRCAPDPVLAASARWAHPRLRRGERLAAGRILAVLPAHDHIPLAAPRRRPVLPVDP